MLDKRYRRVLVESKVSRLRLRGRFCVNRKPYLVRSLISKMSKLEGVEVRSDLLRGLDVEE